MNREELIEKVAAVLRDAMPGLINPEAWPWKKLAEAAVKCIEDDKRGG